MGALWFPDLGGRMVVDSGVRIPWVPRPGGRMVGGNGVRVPWAP